MRRLLLGALVLLLGASPAPQAHVPLYYQDPDGKPFYAAAPKKAADGRDYVPVYEDAPPPSPQASAGAPGHGRILYYRNPMGLPDTSPTPKKDAMGMDYLPVYENEAADANGGIVAVAPGRLQMLGVRTAPVESRPGLTRTVRATGTLQFDERRLAVVTTKVAGWIEHLDVAATGESVRRGQKLAEFYAPDIVAAEREYLVAVTAGLGESAARRLRALDVPAAEIARLRRSGAAAIRIPVLAPADGVVTEKPAIEGMRVSAGEALYRTADLSIMWLIAEVQEQDLGAVQPGERATAQFVAFPGQTFAGAVDFIYPSLSAETRTARVRIVLPNPDMKLRAGMYASVEIEAPASVATGPVLAVPASAVIDSGTRQVVLVERGPGRFEPRRVRVGSRGDGYAQILEGLNSGDRVVVSANFLIDSESNLRAALQSFAAPEGQTGRAR